MAKKKSKASKKVAKKVSSAVSSKPRINGAKKGKQFERDIANELGHIFPNAERMLEYQASGNIGVDIKGTGHFKIQCKRNAAYASIGKIHEVRSEDPNDIPILVTKGNHLPAMAVLPFEALVRMLEVMHGLSPLLKKPEDTSTKQLHDKSEHVDDSFREATTALVEGATVKMAGEIEAASEIIFPVKTKLPKQHKILGLPVYEDEDHTGPEISVVGSYGRSSEHKRFIDFACHEGDPIVVLQSLIHKYMKEGMICKAIHCGSINDLEILFETEAQVEYPVETAKPFNIADLI